MQFGVCCDPSLTAAARRAGFDYAEWSVGALLMPRAPRQDFLAALKQARAAALPYPVLNGFVPADLKITGQYVDASALKEYVTVAFERAEQAGVQIIVFGSGGARQVPDGFDAGEAHKQLAGFCAMFAPIALLHGVTVVVEPLNRLECNVLNTVAECAALVREVSHPALGLLTDAYHLLRDNDSLEDVAANGGILRHAHIATVPTRVAPGAEPCDFAPFFNALARGGYTGRVSIEGSIPAPEKDLPVALNLMRGLAQAAR